MSLTETVGPLPAVPLLTLNEAAARLGLDRTAYAVGGRFAVARALRAAGYRKVRVQRRASAAPGPRLTVSLWEPPPSPHLIPAPATPIEEPT